MSFVPGFDFDEARQCLALSADVESDTPTMAQDEKAKKALPHRRESESTGAGQWPWPVPGIEDWEIAVNPTESVGLDNYWRLYRSRNTRSRYALAVRGTIAAPASILADILVEMIQAQGALTIKGQEHAPGYRFEFDLAGDRHRSGVHLGFLYSVGALCNPHWQFGLLSHLEQVINAGAEEILVTGHSQGAAIATLLRAHIESQPWSRRARFKTYIFAQPKPGNDYWSADFNRRYSNPGFAYRVVNSLDWVPQVPFTLELVTDISEPNPISALPFFLTRLLHPATRRLFWHFHRTRLKEELRASKQVMAEGAQKRDLSSLNYAPAATPIALIGDPNVGQAHPDDMFAQHHLGTYWALMQEQLTTGGDPA